ncbi:MAG: universal stress protein [Desulfobacterales bacterium]
MKIMVCYDASDADDTLIAKAKERAKELDASISLLSVLIGSDVGQLDELEPAKELLAKTQASFQAENIPCETKLVFGGNAAGESIVEYAEEKAIDEIMIGIRKKSKIGKFIFGSTAQYVILEAPCPVLTVR